MNVENEADDTRNSKVKQLFVTEINEISEEESVTSARSSSYWYEKSISGNEKEQCGLKEVSEWKNNGKTEQRIAEEGR